MLYCFSLVEKYRSGHNEPHSKCGVPYGTVGSNPTFSANIEKDNFFKKRIVLFLLSNYFSFLRTFFFYQRIFLGRYGEKELISCI